MKDASSCVILRNPKQVEIGEFPVPSIGDDDGLLEIEMAVSVTRTTSFTVGHTGLRSQSSSDTNLLDELPRWGRRRPPGGE